jgi:serine/threonine-protein kinase RsbT
MVASEKFSPMTALDQQIESVLGRHVSKITARAVLQHTIRLSRADLGRPDRLDRERFGVSLNPAVRLFATDARQVSACVADVNILLDRLIPRPERQTEEAIEVNVLREEDIVAARGAVRDLARSLGFTTQDQIKLATATSELARNIVQYATKGKVTVRALKGASPGLEVVAEDEGSGIADLEEVLAGRRFSKGGMGRGLAGTRELVDDFHVETGEGCGTRVTIRKFRARA